MRRGERRKNRDFKTGRSCRVEGKKDAGTPSRKDEESSQDFVAEGKTADFGEQKFNNWS